MDFICCTLAFFSSCVGLLICVGTRPSSVAACLQNTNSSLSVFHCSLPLSDSHCSLPQARRLRPHIVIQCAGNLSIFTFQFSLFNFHFPTALCRNRGPLTLLRPHTVIQCAGNIYSWVLQFAFRLSVRGSLTFTKGRRKGKKN